MQDYLAYAPVSVPDRSPPWGIGAVQYDNLESKDYVYMQRIYRYERNEAIDLTKTEYDDRIIYLTEQAKKYIRVAKEFPREHGISGIYLFFYSPTALSLLCRTVGHLYNKYCNYIGIIDKNPHKTRRRAHHLCQLLF